MPYRVITPITHLGKAYAVGDPIVLAPHEAYQLLAAKCVEEVRQAPARQEPVFPGGFTRAKAGE